MMCTVTIHRTPEEILVTMNRDEVVVRAPELPPRLHEAQGDLVWIAPHDSEKGGTWMGVNSCGVTACLLNAYLPGESLLPDTSGRYRSRGEIIPTLLEVGNAGRVRTWLLEEFCPESYPSFTLLLTTETGTLGYEWFRQGRPELTSHDAEWFIQSSAGWDSDEVRVWREERFAAWRDNGCASYGTLPQFHVLQDPENAEFSPLMKRSWSATRSITQARVDFQEGRVDLRYWPDPTPEARVPAAHLRTGLTTLDTDPIDAKAG